MMDLTQRQVGHLLLEFDDALRGVNGYDGSTAEIYAYTLLPESPSANIDHPSEKVIAERASQAGHALVSTIALFAQLRGINGEDLLIKLDGREWDKTSAFSFSHRVHVQIERREKTK